MDTGAVSSDAEERDEEEEADVASFLASVSSRNSGAADVAWRLLARVTERWRPSSEGAMGDLAGTTDSKGPNNGVKVHKDAVGPNKGTKGGSFGLRHAPRPATLLRLADTFGPGPEGGDGDVRGRRTLPPAVLLLDAHLAAPLEQRLLRVPRRRREVGQLRTRDRSAPRPKRAARAGGRRL